MRLLNEVLVLRSTAYITGHKLMILETYVDRTIIKREIIIRDSAIHHDQVLHCYSPNVALSTIFLDFYNIEFKIDLQVKIAIKEVVDRITNLKDVT